MPRRLRARGPCKAHFITDPVPLEWLGEYREMWKRTATACLAGTTCATGSGRRVTRYRSPFEKLLDYIQATYLQFARANISAGLAGEKYYEYDFGYGPTRARTQRRLNMARLHVRDELLQVDAGNNAALTQLPRRTRHTRATISRTDCATQGIPQCR